MAYQRGSGFFFKGMGVAAGLCAASVAPAQLFFYPPDFSGMPVLGTEPEIVQQLPGATPAELKANLIWHMRAGLNVAALQCQFAPTLRTVPNYNAILAHHGKELNDSYKAITAYFKRTVKGVRPAQIALDEYTTRSFQSFSTFHGQLGFCQTAAKIGFDALSRPKGQFAQTAFNRMREFRNSLAPSRDAVFPYPVRPAISPGKQPPPLAPQCWDKKDQLRPHCMPTVVSPT